MMSDEDLHEFGLFISGDGIRQSVPWKLGAYGRDGVLSQQQISRLAETFNLQVALLSRVSQSLGRVLDPEQFPYLVCVQRSKAVARADRALAAARADIAAAQKRATTAAMNFNKLYVDDYRDPAGALSLAQTRDQAQRCAADLGQLHAALAAVTRSPSEVLLLEPADKREVIDFRRGPVLRAAFQFWYDAGRKLTYTTDPLTSARSGPLIDFVDALVACVTEPSSTLSGHTVVQALASFRPWTREDHEAIAADQKGAGEAVDL
jgi:hypothetical protein